MQQKTAKRGLSRYFGIFKQNTDFMYIFRILLKFS